jgi:NADH-quinone oxidoreductase subunit C
VTPLSPHELEQAAAEAVKRVDAAALLQSVVARGEVTLIVDKRPIVEIVQALRADARLALDMLVDVTALDWLEAGRQPRFDVVYHLNSLTHGHRLRLRAAVGEGDEECRIDSVSGIWIGAGFMERETWDMFGIRFDGLADHRRILMPENWEGHPLRKDFPLGGATSFYYKQDTDEYAGEPDDLVPRIRVQDSDV